MFLQHKAIKKLKHVFHPYNIFYVTEDQNNVNFIFHIDIHYRYNPLKITTWSG